MHQSHHHTTCIRVILQVRINHRTNVIQYSFALHVPICRSDSGCAYNLPSGSGFPSGQKTSILTEFGLALECDLKVSYI
jgi:hypothetical protein